MNVVFNRQPSEVSPAEIIPKNILWLELEGCIAVVHAESKQGALIPQAIVANLRDLMKDACRVWIKEMDSIVYEVVLEPRIGNCPELQELITQDYDYRKIYCDHHVIETNYGPKTLTDILLSNKETSSIFLATAALNVRNRMLCHKLGKEDLLLDLTELHTRSITQRIIIDYGCRIDFVDDFQSEHWQGAYTLVGRSPDENRLLKFFRQGFTKTIHSDVKLALDTDGVLGDFPAMIMTTTPLPGQCPPGLTERLLLKQWVENSLMLINPQSDLANVILQCYRDDIDYAAVTHGPAAIHTTATLFSVGAFPDQWQHYQWHHVTMLLKHLLEKENSLKRLESERLTAQSLYANTNELDRQLATAKEQLVEMTQEMAALKALLGSPFREC